MKAANLFAAASLLGTATLEPHGWTIAPKRKGSGKKHVRKAQKKIVKTSQKRNRK